MGHFICLHLGNKCFDAGPVTFELFFCFCHLISKVSYKEIYNNMKSNPVKESHTRLGFFPLLCMQMCYSISKGL